MILMKGNCKNFKNAINIIFFVFIFHMILTLNIISSFQKNKDIHKVEVDNELEVEEISNKNQDNTQDFDTFDDQKGKSLNNEDLESEFLLNKHYILKIFTIYEIFMILLLVFYILNCLFGITKNEKIASEWIKNNINYYASNYAHIGLNKEYEIESSLVKESYNKFKFYASGRRNLNYTTINLDLVKRQDLINASSSLFYPPEKDRIIFDISINSNTQHVFCLCRKKEVKFMKSTYEDIDFMTNQYFPDYISQESNLILMTEDDELSDKVFNKNIRRKLKMLEKYIDVIYFTDRKTFSREDLILYASFFIDSDSSINTCITEFIHELADSLATLDINTKKLQTANKLRQDYEEYVESEKLKKESKSSEDSEKKAEEKRLKDEQMRKNLSKEQLAKLEEKEKKERMKKQMKKQYKIVK